MTLSRHAYRPVLIAALSLGCSQRRGDVLHGRASDAGSATVRYLALGDSFTIGTGVGPARAVPAELSARWQRAGCKVALENAAHNGHSSEDLIEAAATGARAFYSELRDAGRRRQRHRARANA